MAGSKLFVEKVEKILVEELGREAAVALVREINSKTKNMQSTSVATTLDRLETALKEEPK